MKRKLLLPIIAIMMCMTVCHAMNGTEKNINVTVNGTEIIFEDQKPVIINDRTLLPIRSVMESMKKNVVWDAPTSTAIISDETTTVKLTIGSDIMEQTVYDAANDEYVSFEVVLDTAAIIINNRTCLPVRAVAEAFMATVDWDSDTSTVLIVTADLLC